LENEGLRSILDELRTYSQDRRALTFVEWAEFSDGELDADRLEIDIKYLGDTEREINFINLGFASQDAFDKLKEDLL